MKRASAGDLFLFAVFVACVCVVVSMAVVLVHFIRKFW